MLEPQTKTSRHIDEKIGTKKILGHFRGDGFSFRKTNKKFAIYGFDTICVAKCEDEKLASLITSALNHYLADQAEHESDKQA